MNRTEVVWLVRGFVHYSFVRGNVARESEFAQGREVATGERDWEWRFLAS